MKKTIFITGSTDGIGKLAAIKLASDGHEVYIHGRNENKLKAVIEEIKAQSNNQNIDGFVADLSSFFEVKKLASDVKNKLKKLDILINNAGVYYGGSLKNENGLDLRFVVNYFAPYLLTKELLELLKKGDAPRLINLSSAAQSPVSIPALQGTQDISENASYAQSKLALTQWSFNMAEEEKGITVIAVNPGSLLNTNMVKEAYGKFWSSADKGGNILYELAVDDTYKNKSGIYFDNDQEQIGRAHADAYNSSKNHNLIQETESILSNL
ncbi:SDR family NAD(P)-dependent oxidoreductase [Flammeovirga yaeyamensis]|uniref:SDR family NAD(P)-dependent oxidoreductase n=1 Tax=Flammeovirga yaeyamensis TaxID=367791 RepID=A0AAX1N017_9BACT|nr:SDR family NAD(P)-dependent oxidoreductase [Flammeovirga yaeyamensis]MBB3700196.1 NAD(P)-dependent dehydrogenase (short-subunit alcohol dehydrogenase family) [Flammeovirga yaeyamensis]NMF37174.1 SDR family NAD(P)-dependent oxidoreductase [Flammeovirga yaeyamensis]QWG00865.1 SDR family NAD(P)-dependent oxidoreductase [Flammeovirga yaeyamensis]